MRKMALCILLATALLLSACSSAEDATQTSHTSGTTQTQPKESDNKVTESSGSNTENSEQGSKPEEEPQEPEAPEEPAVEVKLYELEYAIGSISGAAGADMSNSSRFAAYEYIPLADIEAITVGNGYCLTWFAYDEDKVYLGNGSNTYPTLPAGGVWLADGRDVTAEEILVWNSDSVYVRFAVKRSDGAAITLGEDVTLSDIKVYISGYESENTEKRVSYEKIATIANGRQDGAIYGDLLFSFNSVGECKVYSLDGYSYISEFVLDKNEVLSPHSNSVCFGSYKYAESDEFPLLYCNVYNTYKTDRAMDGTCNVYRIVREGSTFSSQLVQIIKVGFTDNTEKWSSPGGDTRPFGNFTVDTDNNRLYVFTMRDASKTTRFFGFDLPTLEEGVLDSTTGVKKVTLRVENITDSFETEYFYYIQGAAYDEGRIYSLEGFTNDATNRAAIKIADIASGKLWGKVDLYGMGLKTEPEVVYVLDGALHYIDVSGNVYKITFEG